MGLLSRYTQKLFGSTAGANRISQFGSLAAGSPTSYSGATVTPANIQALSNFLSGLDGSLVAGSTTPIQDLNALHFLWSYQLSYLFQQGIPEYDSATTYNSNSLVVSGTTIYRSLTANNVGNNPASGSPWTAAILTRANLPAVNQQISTSCGAFSSTSTSSTSITNLSVTVTTSGRPVVLSLISDGSGNDSYLNASGIGGLAHVGIFRGATLIAQTTVNENDAGNSQLYLPPGCISHLDPVAAGTYTYTLQVWCGSNTTFTCHYVCLAAYEL